MNHYILHYHDQRRAARLNETQAETLIRILDAPLPLSTLAEALGLSPTAITCVARVLEKRGLARRVAIPELDRRKQLLTISEEGTEIVRRFSLVSGGDCGKSVANAPDQRPAK